MEQKIVEILEAEGALTTTELAARLQEDRARVYSVCKRMEEKEGLLKSTLLGGVFFYPPTQEVVEGGTYGQIKAIDDLLLGVIRQFALPEQRAEMIVALEETLRDLMKGSFQAAALEQFQSVLLEAAEDATEERDITKHLGLRPIRPRARRWELA